MCSGALSPQLLQLNQCNRNTRSMACSSAARRLARVRGRPLKRLWLRDAYGSQPEAETEEI
jgi:hypothetical protein